MSKDVELDRRFGIDENDLTFVYAYTEESGGIFGLQLESPLLKDAVIVEYAPYLQRSMHGRNRVRGPFEVTYVDSLGDGTSHGATWTNFRDYLRPITRGFRRMDEAEIELQIDGLQNMAMEGARAYGGGWPVIQRGLEEGRTDIYRGFVSRQYALYRGLFYIAETFARREKTGHVDEIGEAA